MPEHWRPGNERAIIRYAPIVSIEDQETIDRITNYLRQKEQDTPA